MQITLSNNKRKKLLDYDISQNKLGIYRACVPIDIKNGDFFNIYLGKSEKLGVKFDTNLETSLRNLE